MKTFLAALYLAPALLLAQEPGYHTHDGFYLSLSPGIAAGNVVFDNNGLGGGETIFRGGGGVSDFKIGGALTPNFILSFDLIGGTMFGPQVENEGGTFDTDDDFSISDGMAGLGMTYYFLPANSFISGTLGFGRITMRNANSEGMLQTDPGISLNLKIGKEWWVSRNWGLGVAGGYGFLGAREGDFNGDLVANRLYVLFNTTFN